MLELIIDFFNKQEWHYTLIEAKRIVVLRMSGKNGAFQCIVDIQEDEQKFIFFSFCPANVPGIKKVEMSELLTRLNFGRFYGNFEMDYNEGVIRYKTTLYYDTLQITPKIIEHLIMSNIIAMDTALNGIIQLIEGDITPLQAFHLIEKAESE